MKKLNIRRSHALPSEKELELFEKKLGVPLPKEFRNTLRDQNFIDVEENIYFKNGKAFYLDVFYPLASDFELSLEYVFEALSDFLGRDYLAFANDPGGWQYVIGLSRDAYGKVFLCRTDNYPPEALLHIAGTFDEFVSGLTSDIS